MSEPQVDVTSPPAPPLPPPARGRRTNPLFLVLMGVVAALVIFGVMYLVQVSGPAQENRQLNSQLVYNLVGRPGEMVPLTLAERFTDADGDLVADPPTDPAAQIDPPTLTFSYVASHQPELVGERFKEFVAHLSKEVRRPVEYVVYGTPEQQVRALFDGELHVAGINTGNIPTAVNQAGFVPFCGLATEAGVASYQMQIIVPADSPLQRPSDLDGGELTLTEPGSNSGFKAPLVLMNNDTGLQPGRDFQLRYSGGHEASIQGIANKTYRAAAVASDVLQRAMAQDPPLITRSQFRVIYTSENFPTAAFGYVWNLKPDVAERVKQAFTTFEWKGTGMEEVFGASGQVKFVPISFKNDFALVRRIDDAIRSIQGAEATTQAAMTQ